MMRRFDIKTSAIILLLILAANVLSLAARVDTLLVYSASMKKDVPNIIILPDKYESSNKKLPVVYLLHGAGGSYLSWVNSVPALLDLVDKQNIIIVCPDGASTSWYFDSPVDSTMRYETYVSNELVKSVDSTFRTIQSSSGRAITGLSMGGHGGLFLAMRHQDIFGAAGSMSGGVDFTPFPDSWQIAKRLGDYKNNEQVWEEHTVIGQIPLLANSNLALIIDCGVDDFFIEVNRNLHTKLLAIGYPHEYTERPGKHNWEYWNNAVQFQFLYFSVYFANL